MNTDRVSAPQGGAGVQGTPRGIPTIYAGVQFRSRIEAKWAAFFDELRWAWEYEPIDLAGYIPDFVLPFRHAPLLVEVKHATSHGMNEELMPHTTKIVESGWAGEAWVVGARFGLLYDNTALCGILGARNRIDGALEWQWDDALLFWCVPCRGVSVFEANGSWRCRRCGVDDRGHRGEMPEGLLNNAWLEAGNAVQWKGPRR